MLAQTSSLGRGRAAALRLLAVGIVLATAAALLPALDASASDYETVRDQRDALRAEIEDVTESLDDLRARITVAQDEIDALEEQAVELEEEAAGLQGALADRARAAYMRGGEAVPFQSMFTAAGPDQAVERAGMLATLSRSDVAALERTAAVRERQEQIRTLLLARTEELQEMEQELQARGATLQASFDEYAARYTELRRIRDRQRQISRGAQQGTYACIFQGAYHFRDTWGHPRSGGRRHQGTDVMAPYRAPVYAFTDGVISRLSNSRLGGIGLYLRGDDNVVYFYAHLDAYAAGIHGGKRVQAGEHIGYNGYTGNASPSAPHVHFEAHPGGGSPVNPYPYLRTVC